MTVIAEVLAECERATTLHGPLKSLHEGYAVLLEEVDELWADIKENRIAEARAEAIQVAAMAIKIVQNICDGESLLHVRQGAN